MNSKELDWSLFESQEKEISTINNELCQLRKQKYPEYRDSYYRYYNEFGMPGMIGDLYRKFDRLKIMSESYTDKDIRSKEKEITDQFYDIISYCQLQLYWLRREKWGKVSNKIPVDCRNHWNNTDSGCLKTCTDKDEINVPVQSDDFNSRIKRLKSDTDDFERSFYLIENLIISGSRDIRKEMKYVY
jgi:hypothetical protein